MSVWHLRNVTIELIIAAEGSVRWVTAPLWRLIWGDSDWSSKVWAVIRSNQTCFFFSSTAQIACAWMYEYNVSLDKLRLQLRLWGISVLEKTSNYIPISTTWRWSYKRLLLLFFNIVLILVCQECVKDSFNDSPRGKVPHYYSNSLFISLKLWDS